jgi:AIG2-like family
MKHYFAYGTLLDVPSMQAFAPSAEPEGVMRLDGYAMDFAETHQAGKGGCWLKPTPRGAVWGLQYRLSDADMERMDAASGVPLGLWVHLPVTLTDAEGHKVESVTYTIPNDPPAFRPGPDYVAKILAGLSALPVPKDYAAQVRAKIAAATA